ncbi:MAG: hypothetical protein RMJ67_01270 [Elusimicrobiota bacterium]|nr:hypothetical protein [Endomicrobiia bacterium]MDW8165134.1 hypothetical protein [Elusimicrobiota bacterium]
MLEQTLEKIKNMKEIFQEYIKNVYGIEEEANEVYFTFCAKEEDLFDIIDTLIKNNLINYFSVERRENENSCYLVLKIKINLEKV